MKNNIDQFIEKSFAKVPNLWPLQNFIASNPLEGFIENNFEKALIEAQKNFNRKDMAQELKNANIQSVKWLSVFFDDFQSLIKMPNKKLGLFLAFKEVLAFDNEIHFGKKENLEFIKNISNDCKQALNQCFIKLEINNEREIEQAINWAVFGLYGFASHIKYRQIWDVNCDFQENKCEYIDFVAFRILIYLLMVKDKSYLLNFAKINEKEIELNVLNQVNEIKKEEKKYQKELIDKIQNNIETFDFRSKNLEQFVSSCAQFVFCIDVRSESMRRAIEKVGNYETFGFAGFFSAFVNIKEIYDDKYQASCPVLVAPVNKVEEKALYNFYQCHKKRLQKSYNFKNFMDKIKESYCSLKYNFSSPFALVESIGIWFFFASFIKTISLNFYLKLQKFKQSILKIDSQIDLRQNMEDGISFDSQCQYALNSLKSMGLTKRFAPLVFLCGHKSETENNIYNSALQCGACGAREGGNNAKILAQILNKKEVRQFLLKNNINISQKTHFVAAIHNTINDKIEIFEDKKLRIFYKYQVQKIKYDLLSARIENNKNRAWSVFGKNKNNDKDVLKNFDKITIDWSEIQPEWGLANNASFIVGPRKFTKDLNLESRSFLHSYNFEEDEDGASLRTILVAPMIVAYWINSQYLFSTLNNKVFGSQSKITQNLSMKSCVMQGNESDLRLGLALQSICKNYKEAYHKTSRLNSFIFAPKEMIEKIISEEKYLQNLLKNEWIFLFAVQENKQILKLNSDFSWQVIV